jgi:preprotein translocase subunit YajC
MNTLTHILYTNLGQAGAAQGQPGLLGMLVPMLLIVAVMYFLMIRPQQKKQKAHQALINALKSGDRVVTMSGIHGTVAGVDERKNIIYLKIDDNVKIKIERHAVTSVVSDDAEISPK